MTIGILALRSRPLYKSHYVSMHGSKNSGQKTQAASVGAAAW